MRILFLTANAFIPEHFSETTRTLLELCSKLSELGHEPIILAGKTPSQGQSNIFVDQGYGFRIFRALNIVKTLPVLCATLQPDIAVAVDAHFDGVIEECQSLDIPLAVWLFYVEPHYFRDKSLNENLLYLASSSFLASRMFGLFGISAQVVAPYIQQAEFSQAQKGKRVLFINPVREKGIEIAFQIAQQRPAVAFTFMESWGISEPWRALCFERALQCGNIEWLPATIDVDSVLEKTRLVLVPRFCEEGFCRIVTEAQQRGIPVLASDRGYLPENVGSGGTVLKIDCDLNEWFRALDMYLDDDNYYQQMSNHALHHSSRDGVKGSQVIDTLLTLLAAQITKFQQNRFIFQKK